MYMHLYMYIVNSLNIHTYVCTLKRNNISFIWLILILFLFLANFIHFPDMVSSKSANSETTSNATDNKNDDDGAEVKSSTTRSTSHTTSRTAPPQARVPNDQRCYDDNENDNDESTSSNGCGTTTMTSAAAKQSLAFTIDNFNDKDCDAAAQAAKYKSMMERFQSRHRRGASMSKLENDESAAGKAQTPTRLTSSQSSTPLTTTRSSARNSVASEENNVNSLDSETSATQKVKSS